MSAFHTKSVQLQDQIRRALRSGRYLPGDRIDPASLAAEFSTSLMPARLALERLVGEGLLEHHARGGVYLPLPVEIELRDAYDWMQRLLLMACDVGIAARAPGGVRQPQLPSNDGDLVEATWQLFDAIAHATGHTFLYPAVRRTNDQLAPIRRAKPGLVDDAFEELAALNRHWQQRDLPSLRSALHDYHERRKQLVPCITVTLKRQHEHRQ
ncbi:GntR family transcriptional regulator [Luteimonas sp. RD2P54]|uniref:GntR family transcriptional regulator n=1 Tax=Luteimonas endophytica TaxID=3042023 RepID=A0ABT6JAQ3_9GAMM|nr:GntR family transcriptional regulator [Luteimonas endophytica]MDH5821919.1 GntR family transcriptional regulator [Luteimonas endophytica]MDH5822711.1 GntR family transcriptional regulator [Luteimonas endophytica]MDH5823901.1 GntR family transcriptional regulator [Luteimonas endophytica]MDH5823909.1 GntR family transcriptional regulator [Luteimonas endophytica]